ncbi:MAG: class I SAM-dependent methyltransferase [Bacteroidales bacterium]|jgi:hypothetical protein|nr:class I SAM-dependent methyltransferase [Bacteroidales bacterium]
MDKKGYISRIREDLRGGRKHSKTTIESVAKGFGITNKNLVKEYTELAIVLNAREVAHDSSLSTYEKYLDIVALYKSQVNLSMRTSMSVLMQQYSTPAPISFLASSYILKSGSLSGYKAFKNIVKGSTKGKIIGNAHLTNNNNFPKYLEPSAGNGLLTIALPYPYTYVNELDDVRLSNLKEQPFAKVSSWNALKPPVAYDGKFDGVITNPPFGSLPEAIKFNNFKIKRLEHAMAINTLRCMKDDGKAAIIIGGHTSWDKQGRVTAGNNRIFLNYLYHFYNVEDVIPINGKKLYSRQGTSFNTRLILIDGAKTEPQGAAPLKNKLHSTVVDSHEELWDRVGLESSTTSKNVKIIKLRAKAILIKQKQLTIGNLPKTNKSLRILVACEESQTVTLALRKKGHEAYSCDILPTTGKYPQWHIQDDVLNQLDKGWDMMIAFPPCTYLTVSGNAWMKDPQRQKERKKALAFISKLMKAPIDKIAIENPVGVISTKIRKPDQIIQPYHFGDKAKKTTCLWLKNLPLLEPTKIIDENLLEYKHWYDKKKKSWRRQPLWYYKARDLSDEERRRVRSKTFQGIANAMADQWVVAPQANNIKKIKSA